jgi:hypothetical protein
MAENGHVPGLQANEEQPPTTESSTTETTEEEKPNIDRATVLSHVVKIFRYTALHIWWFFGGFVFLLVYSGARIFIPYYTGQVM